MNATPYASILANFPCALARELHIKACNFTTTCNLISQWRLRLKATKDTGDQAFYRFGEGSPGRNFIRKEAVWEG